MKNRIEKYCRSIEEEFNITILFAVENGSRVWGMQSDDSDYDVRFVFARPLTDYIQIHKPKEVINLAYDQNGARCPIKGSLVDISGFDVFKFVRLLSNSNPSMIEWLMSDIVYYGKQNPVFKRFALEQFSKKALFYHYKSLCKKNYITYLKSKRLVTYKKYLYSFRGIFNAKWVVYKKTIPPIRFHDTIKAMDGIISDNILIKIKEIIRLKSDGKEKDIIQNIVSMDRYIEDFLKDDVEISSEEPLPDIKILNKELRRIIIKSK